MAGAATAFFSEHARFSFRRAFGQYIMNSEKKGANWTVFRDVPGKWVAIDRSAA